MKLELTDKMAILILRSLDDALLNFRDSALRLETRQAIILAGRQEQLERQKEREEKDNAKTN